MTIQKNHIVCSDVTSAKSFNLFVFHSLEPPFQSGEGGKISLPPFKGGSEKLKKGVELWCKGRSP